MYDFETPPSLGSINYTGSIRHCPEDFRVTEVISFSPSGSGDHIYLYVKKRECNTDWVAQQLAKVAGLKLVDVGYAGKKDRHAVTRQWFSLHMPNQPEPDWENALPDEINILEKTRHEKKLKSGAIKENQFCIVVREIEGDMADIERRLLCLKDQGMPNYFGQQRFGNNNGNVRKLIEMVKHRRRVKRTQRGIYISAGRSFLFNQILKQRILQKNWNQAIDGDVMMLDGSKAIFVAEADDEQLVPRVNEMDIHPASMLWGRGERLAKADAAIIEAQVLEANSELLDALDQSGSQLSYRALRVNLSLLEWQSENNSLTLNFSLPTGAYATSLLNEVVNTSGFQNAESVD